MTKKRMAAFSTIGIFAIISGLFFTAEHFLPDEWYYIPERASIIASMLCTVWSFAVMGGVYFVSSCIKNKAEKITVTVIAVVIGFAVIVILVWNCILYNANHMVKIEQYDEHIALYVENTFIRAENRHPCYRYEENWLLMRELSEDELNNAIINYGDPNNYYQKHF